jgi:hypothetical protein
MWNEWLLLAGWPVETSLKGLHILNRELGRSNGALFNGSCMPECERLNWR